MFYIALNTYIQDITLSLTSWSISADINLLYTYIQDIALSLTSWSISAAINLLSVHLYKSLTYGLYSKLTRTSVKKKTFLINYYIITYKTSTLYK